jgi:hypothetical protein
MKRLIAVVAALVLVSGCGSNSSPTTPTPTATRIISVSGNLSFGDVAVGSTATRIITITNSGNSTLNVTSISGPNAGVYTASWFSGPIAAGGSQQSTIGFSPTAAQVYSGVAFINGDQTSGNNGINVSGTGTLLKADIHLAGSTGLYSCFVGVCTSFTYPITNTGAGCATNIQVITRFFGSDGNGIQLGIDVPMYLPGGSFSTFVFRPGATVTIQNLGPFNDIRSAHTAFKVFPTWTDVSCSSASSINKVADSGAYTRMLRR